MDLPAPLPQPEEKTPNGGIPKPSESLTESEDPEPTNTPPPLLPEESLKKLPPEDREKVRRLEMMSVEMMGVYGGSLNPIAQKITPEIISEMIKSQARDTDLSYEDKKDSRSKATIVYISTLVFIAILVVGLAVTGQKDVLIDLITKGLPYLLLAATSFGGGYGFKAWRDSRGED